MTQSLRSVVVIGGGLAGAKTVEALRDRGYDGAITLVGEETEPPYERPQLSKGYLIGKSDFEAIHPESWYTEHDVDLRLGQRAESIDRTGRSVRLANGDTLTYDALVLATGAEPRRLPIPGAEDGLTLRNHDDADAIRNVVGDGHRLAIVGAGWIGLEVAAAARQGGADVTVLDVAPLPLLNVLGPELAEVFAALHRERGVDLRLGVSIADLSGGAVRLADGTAIAADALLLGVGVRPRTDLAEAAGLDVDNGVLVDAALRSSDPAIFAVGDIANQQHPVLGGRIRVEHWATALNQPKTAAAAILGEAAEFANLPYFYSDQYDLGMEYVGYAPPGSYERVVVRGDLGSREFVAFWIDTQGHVLAGMNVNVWDVVDDIKPLISDRVPVDLDALADPAVPLAELR